MCFEAPTRAENYSVCFSWEFFFSSFPYKGKNRNRFKKNEKFPPNPGTAHGGWLEEPFCLNG